MFIHSSAMFHDSSILNGDIITLTSAHVNTEGNVNKYLHVVPVFMWISAPKFRGVTTLVKY